MSETLQDRLRVESGKYWQDDPLHLLLRAAADVLDRADLQAASATKMLRYIACVLTGDETGDVIVVDRVDHFDGPTQDVFTELVSGWNGQVVAMMTKPDDWQAPDVEGVTFYRLSRDLEAMGPTTIARCGDVAGV